MRINEAGHNRLARNIDRACGRRRLDTILPTAAMRLSVTRTSPVAITSSPFIVMIRAPDKSTDPFGRERVTSTVTSARCGSVASMSCRKSCEPHAPRDGRRIVRPAKIVAAFVRHPLDRHGGITAASLNAHFDRLAAGDRHRTT
jgi:hypothetical protein